MRTRTLSLITALSCTLAPAPALASEGATYYSTKQHYQPQGSSYAEAPSGFHQIYTSTVDRHGSRGLSSFKYDDLAQQMLEYAQQRDQLTELGTKLIPQVEAMIAVNRELSGGPGQEAGYGNLTEVGREELRGIGKRNAQRNAELLGSIAAEDLKVSFTSSGEDRANDSGWNFGEGLLEQSPSLATHLDDDTKDGHVNIAARPDLMYAHKDKNAASYQRYTEWKDSQALQEKLQQAYAKPESQQAARSLLAKIFTPEFINGLADGSVRFSAREKDDKSVEGIVDAALQFYNLYIIAPALEHEEKAPAEGWIFDEYMDDNSGPTFAYLLDVEDFYEKGPAIQGQTIAYDNYEPLLEEMIRNVQDRAAGGDVAANYRFGHAETIIPLAALLKLPGSEQGVPEDDLYSWDNSAWRGDTVSPMGANIQWDAFQNDRGETLVRMLYNEKEIPFHDGCEPIAADSTFYTIEELADCLPLGSTSDHSQAHLMDAEDAADHQLPVADSLSSKPQFWGIIGVIAGALAISIGIGAVNAFGPQIQQQLHKFGSQLPF
ncbi:histidine-type phosphatase [Corynebacterium sp. KPL2680]|uniref:histidine-type phosphatase n=1 Tax=Corynebacterium sp. KPL2680 TaxID=3158310 RepID=UPI0032EF9DAA